MVKILILGFQHHAVDYGKIVNRIKVDNYG